MINADKPHLWKADVAKSVEMYNSWFLGAAPETYRESRRLAARHVDFALAATQDLTSLNESVLRESPGILNVLRMATAPPIARDRLVGLAGVTKSLVHRLESGELPPRMPAARLSNELRLICGTIAELLDSELFPWLQVGQKPSDMDRQLASVVVADRLTGAQADPIIRNAQEQRQIAVIERWLLDNGYSKADDTDDIRQMRPGTYSFRRNIVVGPAQNRVNIPIDVVIQPRRARTPNLPVLIEAKSAGDFTNTNKRRKEEAQKVHQIQATYGQSEGLSLFLCGYFDTGYLGYEAAEGIDWIWEHRVEDLAKLGLE